MLQRLLVIPLLASGCLARYAPPRLDPKTPLTLALNGPQARVDITLDARGIPHVFGQSETDLAFGLGFMHGRDRTFQVLVMKHAARGRLTELFGADGLPLDQQLRILSYRLPEASAALSARDRSTLEAYAKGVNAGAAHAGPAAELVLLGVPFGEFTAEDSFAIMRLQSWTLSGDHRDELARAQLLARLPPGDQRINLFDAPIWTGGVPIVSGAAVTQPSTRVERARTTVTVNELPAAAAELAHRLGLDQLGASNSWAVHGSRTESGVPVLCNDPHLSHELPSVFYLAHLEHPEFTGVGVTFAGIPAVLIGHTRSLAWGMTVSYADSQDLFRLQVSEDGSGYVVDGVTVPFERLEQRFKLGRKADAEVKTETWLATRFGPVLPASTVRERYALSWPGFEVGGSNVEPISGFWDFLRARNVEEATSAIERFQTAGQNVALAFTDGTIAYRLATYAPQRPEGVTGRVPRDGSRAVETRLLKQADKPALTNPPNGFLVAANQRVIADDDPRAGAVGTSGVPPHRARRIHQRLEALLGTKKATPDELLAIQQDVVSLEARDVVPVLGAACPSVTPRHEADQVKAFCAALRGFDGVFSTDSVGALPFVSTLAALRAQVVRSLGFEEPAVRSLARSFPVTNAVHQGLLAGGRSPLFGEGLEAMMPRVIDDALDDVIARTGKRPSD
ncbi:MAG: penicillin acylase family protein, partial [Archangium sp.]|nr:penicillin acylase family protein [Archangium sp.]